MRSDGGRAVGVRVLLLLLALVGCAWAARHALANLWLSATDGDYRVPATASWWQFEPTVMNPGSGGWWLYGEDAEHYYHFRGTGTPPYRSISRAAASTCQGFDPRRVETWCG